MQTSNPASYIITHTHPGIPRRPGPNSIRPINLSTLTAATNYNSGGYAAAKTTVFFAQLRQAISAAHCLLLRALLLLLFGWFSW
jgi:hypothetical protein